MVKKILTLCCFSIYLVSAVAQDFFVDSKQVFDHLKNTEFLRAVIEIKVFDDKGEELKKYAQNMILNKIGLNYYTKTNNIEAVYFNDKVLTINKKNKLMYIVSRPANLPDVMQQVNGVSADSLMQKRIKNVRFKQESEGFKRYTMDVDISSINQMEYLFNPMTNVIKSVSYFYNISKVSGFSKSTATFSLFDTSPYVDTNIFKEDNYFRKEGDKYLPVSGYEGFKVIVQL